MSGPEDMDLPRESPAAPGRGEPGRTECGRDATPARLGFLEALTGLLHRAQATAEGAAAASVAAALAAVELAEATEVTGARFVEAGPVGGVPLAHGSVSPRAHRCAEEALPPAAGERARKAPERGKEASRDFS